MRMFFASQEMQADYKRFRDLVIINRKFVKTKYKAAITMFYGVDSYGVSVPFGFSFVHGNEDPDKEWIIDQFLKCHIMLEPHQFIIDHNSGIKHFLKRKCKTSKIVYCNTHFTNSLKHEFAVNKLFEACSKENKEALLFLVEKPLPDEELRDQLKALKEKAAQEENLRNFIESRESDFKYWSKKRYLNSLTYGVDTYARN